MFLKMFPVRWQRFQPSLVPRCKTPACQRFPLLTVQGWRPGFFWLYYSVQPAALPGSPHWPCSDGHKKKEHIGQRSVAVQKLCKKQCEFKEVQLQLTSSFLESLQLSDLHAIELCSSFFTFVCVLVNDRQPWRWFISTFFCVSCHSNMSSDMQKEMDGTCRHGTWNDSN